MHLTYAPLYKLRSINAFGSVYNEQSNDIRWIEPNIKNNATKANEFCQWTIETTINDIQYTITWLNSIPFPCLIVCAIDRRMATHVLFFIAMHFHYFFAFFLLDYLFRNEIGNEKQFKCDKRVLIYVRRSYSPASYWN